MLYVASGHKSLHIIILSCS